MDRRVVLPAALGVHLGAAFTHGASHELIPVTLAPWLNALVLATVFVGPVVGVALTLRGRPLGVPLFTISMAAALVLGGVLHFIVENPDHVHAIPASQWRLAFQASAVGVAVTPAVGTVAGAWYWRNE